MTTKTAIRKMNSAKRAAAKIAVAAVKAVQALEDGTLKAGQTAVRNGIEYLVDSKGRTVRQPSKDKPVTKEEVVHMIKGVRVVDEEEVLFAVGPNVLRFMLDQGYLVRKPGSPFLWVTKKAGENYALPKPTTLVGTCEFA